MSTPRGLARNTHESGWVHTASLLWQKTTWAVLSGNWAVWPTKQRRTVVKRILTLHLDILVYLSGFKQSSSRLSPWFFGGRCRTTWFRHVLAIMDLTVFPANAALVKSAMNVMSNVLNLGVSNIAHIQLPISQSQTAPPALVKHRRLVEDYFQSQGFDVTGKPVALNFETPPDATQSDTRGGVQLCLCLQVQGSNQPSPWTRPGVVGPLHLIRVMDMIGYDPESKPAPSQRTEQQLGGFAASELFKFAWWF